MNTVVRLSFEEAILMELVTGFQCTKGGEVIRLRGEKISDVLRRDALGEEMSLFDKLEGTFRTRGMVLWYLEVSRVWVDINLLEQW